MIRTKYIIWIFSFLILASCTVKKDKDDISLLGKIYHNTTARYNGYFNADLLMQESMAGLNQDFVEDYDTLLPVYPYMANPDVDAHFKTLDKIIEKVTTVSALHRQSHWLDDNYLMLGKANFLKKNYKEANAAFQYLVTNFDPVSPSESAREVKSSGSRVKQSKAAFKKQKKEQEKRRKEINKKRKKERKEALKRRKKGKKRPERPQKTEQQIETQEEEAPLLASAQQAPPPPVGGGLISPESNPENYKLKHSPVYQEGLLWEARTWTAQQNYYSAQARLMMIINDPNTAEAIRDQAYVALVDSYVKSNDYEKAIQNIDLALDRKIDRETKIRLAFLAGQLSEKVNKNQQAVGYFDQVRKLRPSYEKDFYAQLYTAKIQGGDLIGKFQDLLKNPNNAPYQGEIYYVMGEAYRNNYDFRQAVSAYKKVATGEYEVKPITLAKANLAIADIYFEEPDYRRAKQYYDQSVSLLPDNHRDKTRARERAQNLAKVAGAEETIHLQDSLLVIANYDDAQKKELALKIKRERQNSVDAGQAGTDSSVRPNVSGTQSALQRGAGSAQSSFFAYDDKKIKQGERAFERKWGDRQLADNWRYSSSGGGSSSDDHVSSGRAVSFGITQTEIDEILQDVPSTPEDIAIVNAVINQAMLDKGFGLRSDLNKLSESNNVLLQLVSRSPDQEIAAEATYLLYLNAREAGDNSKASEYKKQFDSQFGKTKFNEKIKSSSSLPGKEDVAESALSQVEKNYNQGNYEQVIELTEKSASLFKDRKDLAAKFAMFEAKATGKLEGREAYIEKLQYLVANFPDSDESKTARNYLQVLGAEVKTDITGTSSTSDGDVVFNKNIDNTPHYILVSVKNSEDINGLKATVSDFNKEFFQNESMSISTVQISTDEGREPALLIRRFSNKEDAMNYYQVALKNMKANLEELNAEVFPLAISNYRFLITENKIEDYKSFLREVYNITL